MTIFNEIAQRLIRSECNTAIESSEAESNGAFASWVRNEKLSAEKRRLLNLLLGELDDLTEVANDSERKEQLQELLQNYKEKVVAATKDRQFTEKDTPGTTEVLLGLLSQTLQLTYMKLGKMKLINISYNQRDALDIFYCLIGLYLANRVLKDQQEENQQSGLVRRVADRVADSWLPDSRSFIKAQKELVAQFFNQCPANIKAWDKKATEEPDPVEDNPLAQSERACKVIAYVNNLQKKHQALIEAQGSFVAQIEIFKFYSTMLNKWLTEATEALEEIWGIDTLTTDLTDGTESVASSDHAPSQLTPAVLARHNSLHAQGSPIASTLPRVLPQSPPNTTADLGLRDPTTSPSARPDSISDPTIKEPAHEQQSSEPPRSPKDPAIDRHIDAPPVSATLEALDAAERDPLPPTSAKKKEEEEEHQERAADVLSPTRTTATERPAPSSSTEGLIAVKEKQGSTSVMLRELGPVGINVTTTLSPPVDERATTPATPLAPATAHNSSSTTVNSNLGGATGGGKKKKKDGGSTPNYPQ